jgi:hypothetical protein
MFNLFPNLMRDNSDIFVHHASEFHKSTWYIANYMIYVDLMYISNIFIDLQ